MKQFFKDMFSSKPGVSSKRVFGGLGFVCAIIFIAIWARDFIDLLLITSATMLGLETISSIFTPKQNK